MRHSIVRSLTYALALTMLSIASAGRVLSQETVPPLVRQMYNGQWLDKTTIEQLNKESFYQHGIEAYEMTLPVLNIIGLRDGSEARFGNGYNVLPIWKDRMNAKTWVPTPNCDVIYSMSYLDLKETGPLVVYAPPHVHRLLSEDPYGRRARRARQRRGWPISAPPSRLQLARSGWLLHVSFQHIQRVPVLPHSVDAG